MRYELIIYWSRADECFVVEVPELAGCMADPNRGGTAWPCYVYASGNRVVLRERRAAVMPVR